MTIVFDSPRTATRIFDDHMASCQYNLGFWERYRPLVLFLLCLLVSHYLWVVFANAFVFGDAITIAGIVVISLIALRIYKPFHARFLTKLRGAQRTAEALAYEVIVDEAGIIMRAPLTHSFFDWQLFDRLINVEKTGDILLLFGLQLLRFTNEEIGETREEFFELARHGMREEAIEISQFSNPAA